MSLIVQNPRPRVQSLAACSERARENEKSDDEIFPDCRARRAADVSQGAAERLMR
jgi:hypothetical protein